MYNMDNNMHDNLLALCTFIKESYETWTCNSKILTKTIPNRGNVIRLVNK